MDDAAAGRHDEFLSHSSPDKPAVRALGERLEEAGLVPWLDEWNLVPGEPWQPEIERALLACDACAVFIGPGELRPWHHAEMQAAISRQISNPQQKLRVIPVLLPGAGEPDSDRLPSFLGLNTWVDFRDSLDDPEAMIRLACGVLGLPPGRFRKVPRALGPVLRAIREAKAAGV